MEQHYIMAIIDLGLMFRFLIVAVREENNDQHVLSLSYCAAAAWAAVVGAYRLAHIVGAIK